MSLVIRLETTPDQVTIWHAHQAAFGDDAEANLVDALRDGGLVEVSLVALVDGGDRRPHPLQPSGHRYKCWNGGRPVARSDGGAAGPPAARYRQ